MCGICGYGLAQDDEPPPLQSMVDLLSHRGPDGQGQLDDGRVAVGMRRLAIIDVAGGDQPISNEDETVWVVLNGEIYNYRELRQSLLDAGHAFATESDTEVLVHMYEDDREGMFEALRGMYAVCVYDRRNRSLLLGRDPFGEKPLYYYRKGETIIFASEIRSLLASDAVPRKLDYEALGYYLRAGLVPSPLTMFAGIRQVEPGTWMQWKSGSVTQGRHWAPDYTTSPDLKDADRAEQAVAEALRQAVRRQLVSERPLGAFLSGGIDSSAVVTFCQEALQDPIKTFTVGFEDADYDESAIARSVATSLGTDHREHRVANAEFRTDQFWKIVDHVGLPFGDSSAIPTHMISQVAAQEVTVCLSGDGGDEMFGGYPDFRWGLTVGRLGRLPKPVLRAGAGMAGVASRVDGFGGSTTVRRARRALRAAQEEDLAQFVALRSLFDDGEVRALTADPRTGFANTPLDRLTNLPTEAVRWSSLRKLMYYRTKHVLAEDMLVKIDRMSMACSLEIRAPFLDLDVAKVAMALPDEHLIRRREQKYMLRQLIRTRVPSAVLTHPKMGFSIPLHRIQNEEYQELSDELLNGQNAIMELFSLNTVNTVKSRALERQDDRADASVYRASHQLWMLMQLAGWARRFGVAA